MKAARSDRWGWMANLVLLLLFLAVAGWGWWKDTLIRLEETRLRQQAQLLRTENAFGKAKIRQLREGPEPTNPAIRPWGSEPRRFDAWITDWAFQSGLEIRKLALGEPEPDRMIPVTLEVTGDFPAAQRLLGELLQPGLQLQPNRIELSQNPDPGPSLILTVQVKIPAVKGGLE